jgi:hypothetical protein
MFKLRGIMLLSRGCFSITEPEELVSTTELLAEIVRLQFRRGLQGGLATTSL